MASDSFPKDTHWRDSARSPRFFLVDARAAFPVFLFLMHIKYWTATLALVTILFFGVLERFGFTLPIFWRWLRCFIAGSRKMSIPWWKI